MTVAIVSSVLGIWCVLSLLLGLLLGRAMTLGSLAAPTPAAPRRARRRVRWVPVRSGA